MGYYKPQPRPYDAYRDSGINWQGSSTLALINLRDQNGDPSTRLTTNQTEQQRAANAEAARRELERRAEAERAMAQIAEQRQAAINQQQAALQALKIRSAEIEQEQMQQVASLQGQQQERLQGIRVRGNAVTQSLQILARQGGTQAPTAATSRARATQGGARSTTASLRMGTTGRGTGAGANIAV